MTLQLICTDCARMLGAPTENLSSIPWEHEKACACDNCSNVTMLKSLEEFEIRLDRYMQYLFIELGERRKKRRVSLSYVNHEPIFVDKGPQVFDMHQALLQSKIDILENIKKAREQA